MIGESQEVSTDLEPVIRTSPECKLLTCLLQVTPNLQSTIQDEIVRLIPSLWKTDSIRDFKVFKGESNYFKLLLATLPLANSDAETLLKSTLTTWTSTHGIELQITSETLELVE